MKKILFGIALILFAMLLHMTGVYPPFIGPYVDDLMFGDQFAVLIAFAGLVIAGIGAFTKDK